MKHGTIIGCCVIALAIVLQPAVERLFTPPQESYTQFGQAFVVHQRGDQSRACSFNRNIPVDVRAHRDARARREGWKKDHGHENEIDTVLVTCGPWFRG